MNGLAVDTWAFVELALGRPRAPDVAAAFEAAPRIFTVREVVAETYGFLQHKTGSLRARAWLAALAADEVPILAPDVHAVREAIFRLPKTSSLSFVDVSLGLAATEEGTTAVATADREFRRMRLDPVFAP